MSTKIYDCYVLPVMNVVVHGIQKFKYGKKMSGGE
jgi:hypothetical protein